MAIPSLSETEDIILRSVAPRLGSLRKNLVKIRKPEDYEAARVSLEEFFRNNPKLHYFLYDLDKNSWTNPMCPIIESPIVNKTVNGSDIKLTIFGKGSNPLELDLDDENIRIMLQGYQKPTFSLVYGKKTDRFEAVYFGIKPSPRSDFNIPHHLLVNYEFLSNGNGHS